LKAAVKWPISSRDVAKRFVEVACLDGARTFQQSPDRACHAGADQHRKQDAEDSGDCRQRGQLEC
jgi:hypothetical protein